MNIEELQRAVIGIGTLICAVNTPCCLENHVKGGAKGVTSPKWLDGQNGQEVDQCEARCIWVDLPESRRI